MFFPPLAIANSLSNLLTSAIGSAVKMAVDTSVKEFGMPKFLGEMARNMIDSEPEKHLIDAGRATDVR